MISVASSSLEAPHKSDFYLAYWPCAQPDALMAPSTHSVDEDPSPDRHDVSPDSGNEDPNQVEERVQVDRRRLEQMISTDVQKPDDHFLTAEEFFSHIMSSTGAQISWPTRLKIGAKTKKDPFVKISGLPSQVQIAKEHVLHVLRSRQTRVTLKIDVPYTDHSHIIGRQGKNTQKVMKETGCHIHFPDSNKNQDLDKSNQVSIAGPPKMVEKARRMIRELAPLTVTFELKNLKPGVNPQELAEHPALESMTATEELHVLVRHNRSSGQPFALIRGSACQETQIRTAAQNLQERLFLPGTPLSCSTSLEVLQPQQEAVKGPGCSNIHIITQRTGATIHYPSVERSGATTFYIQGPLDSILAARRYIIGCLPVFVMFDLRPDQGVELDTSILEKEHNVNVSIKPKRGSDLRSVLVRGQECNMTNVFAVRSRLMGDADEMVLSAEFSFMADLCCPQTAAAQAQAASWMSSMASMGVGAAVSPSLLFSSIPMSAVPLPVSPMGAPPSSDYVSDGSAPGFGAVASDSSSSRRDSPTEDLPLSNLTIQAREEEPQTPKALKPEKESVSTPTGSRPPNDPIPGRSPIASAVFESAQKINRNGGWKAPGVERSTKMGDYDHKRCRAAKVMQQNPQGVRFPNSFWSGLGFSKTMNDVQLRALATAERSSAESPSASIRAPTQRPLALLADVAEDEVTDQLGRWPPGENASPLYQRKTFLSTTYFDCLKGAGPDASWGHIRAAGTDLTSILTCLNLGGYSQKFIDQEVDFDTFLSLNEEDLKDLGINTLGARKRIKTAIDTLKAIKDNEKKKDPLSA